MIWFTSDEHIGHANIIAYSSRPFRDVDHMTSELIARHNTRVGPDDTVYHLGDLSLQERYVEPYVRALNGHHVLVPGNHDKCHPHFGSKANGARSRYERYGIERVFGLHETIRVGGIETLLSHMPYDWDYADQRYIQYRPSDAGFPLACGHVHEKWKTRGRAGDERIAIVNVGVDQWDYAPVSEDELAAAFGLAAA